MLGDFPDFSSILETLLHDPFKMGLVVKLVDNSMEVYIQRISNMLVANKSVLYLYQLIKLWLPEFA
jgi:hypothetical protein